MLTRLPPNRSLVRLDELGPPANSRQEPDPRRYTVVSEMPSFAPGFKPGFRIVRLD